MTAKHAPPAAGEVFRVRYPFVQCVVDIMTEDGPIDLLSWRPGCEYEMRGGYGEYEGHSVAIAHGVGEMVLTVEAVFKPGRFPVRVFYTRKFVTPEGREFGKGRLRIATVEKFRRLSKSYQCEYVIEGYEAPAPPAPPLVQDYHGFAAAPAWEMEGRDGPYFDDLPF